MTNFRTKMIEKRQNHMVVMTNRCKMSNFCQTHELPGSVADLESVGRVDAPAVDVILDIVRLEDNLLRKYFRRIDCQKISNLEQTFDDFGSNFE